MICPDCDFFASDKGLGSRVNDGDRLESGNTEKTRGKSTFFCQSLPVPYVWLVHTGVCVAPPACGRFESICFPFVIESILVRQLWVRPIDWLILFFTSLPLNFVWHPVTRTLLITLPLLKKVAPVIEHWKNQMYHHFVLEYKDRLGVHTINDTNISVLYFRT